MLNGNPHLTRPEVEKLLNINFGKHRLNSIYCPPLANGRLVNPDPYRADNLGEPIWHGAVNPSPFGNHTKGELMPAYESRTRSCYIGPAHDPFEDDEPEVSAKVAPIVHPSDLPAYKFNSMMQPAGAARRVA